MTHEGGSRRCDVGNATVGGKCGGYASSPRPRVVPDPPTACARCEPYAEARRPVAAQPLVEERMALDQHAAPPEAALEHISIRLYEAIDGTNLQKGAATNGSTGRVGEKGAQDGRVLAACAGARQEKWRRAAAPEGAPANGDVEGLPRKQRGQDAFSAPRRCERASNARLRRAWRQRRRCAGARAFINLEREQPWFRQVRDAADGASDIPHFLRMRRRIAIEGCKRQMRIRLRDYSSVFDAPLAAVEELIPIR